MTEALNDELKNVNRDANAEYIFETFQNVVLCVAKGVMKMGKNKGPAWWTEEVWKAVKENIYIQDNTEKRCDRANEKYKKKGMYEYRV